MSERSVLGADGHAPRHPEASVQARATGLVPLRRTVETDKEWVNGVSGLDLSNHIFERVSAKKVRFEEVDFRYSVFDGCYLRLCVLNSCDFTGCRFVGSSFHGATFEGCKFDYAVFERTLIDNHILDTCCPPYENLKLRFAEPFGQTISLSVTSQFRE